MIGGGPPSELRARVLAEIARTPSPTRDQHRRRVALIAAAGVVTTASLFFAMGGLFRGSRPIELVVLTAGSGLAGAVVMTRIGSRSRLLGPPRSLLLASTVAVVSVFALVAWGAAAHWPEVAREVIPPPANVGCAIMTVLQGLLPLAAMLVARRRSDPVHPAAAGAALGMTAGAWALTMAYLRCPHAEALHCTAAHVAPTLVLTALGAVLGRALLRVRVR